MYDTNHTEGIFYPMLQDLTLNQKQIAKKAKDVAWTLFHARNQVEYDLDEPSNANFLKADPFYWVN